MICNDIKLQFLQFPRDFKSACDERPVCFLTGVLASGAAEGTSRDGPLWSPLKGPIVLEAPGCSCPCSGRFQLQSQQLRPIGPSPTPLSQSFSLVFHSRLEHFAGTETLLENTSWSWGGMCGFGVSVGMCACVGYLLTEAGDPKGGGRKNPRWDGGSKRGHWLEHEQRYILPDWITNNFDLTRCLHCPCCHNALLNMLSKCCHC